MPLNMQKYANPRWPSLGSVGVDLCVEVFAGKLLQWWSNRKLWVFSTGVRDGEHQATWPKYQSAFTPGTAVSSPFWEELMGWLEVF